MSEKEQQRAEKERAKAASRTCTDVMEAMKARASASRAGSYFAAIFRAIVASRPSATAAGGQRREKREHAKFPSNLREMGAQRRSSGASRVPGHQFPHLIPYTVAHKH